MGGGFGGAEGLGLGRGADELIICAHPKNLIIIRFLVSELLKGVCGIRGGLGGREGCGGCGKQKNSYIPINY